MHVIFRASCLGSPDIIAAFASGCENEGYTSYQTDMSRVIKASGTIISSLEASYRWDDAAQVRPGLGS